jgi:hypothetical protein
MGQVLDLGARRHYKRSRRPADPRAELPLVLSRLLAAGATEFARVALDAWGNHEMEADELLELCATYAAVAGLENA